MEALPLHRGRGVHSKITHIPDKGIEYQKYTCDLGTIVTLSPVSKMSVTGQSEVTTPTVLLIIGSDPCPLE